VRKLIDLINKKFGRWTVKLGPIIISIHWGSGLGLIRWVKIHIGLETKRFREIKKTIRQNMKKIKKEKKGEPYKGFNE